jgi:hypothetical protein
VTAVRYRHRPRRNWGCRLHETTVQGIEAVVLENRSLRLTVLTGKGTDLVECLYKPLDLDFVWLTADGIRDPADVAGGAADDVAAFIDHYEGGWQEVFPNGGAPASLQGAALAQHGEVAGLPWDWEIVSDRAEAVALRCTVRARRLPFRLAKTIRLAGDGPVLEIESTSTNESGVTLPAMWGAHVALGRPFLRPGSRIRLPRGLTVLPHPVPIDPLGRRRFPGEPSAWRQPRPASTTGAGPDLAVLPEPGAPSEIVYLTGFAGEGWYEVHEPRAGAAFRLDWDAATWPYLWFWQEYGATTGYPWWGRHYNIGLEPFSSWPTNGLAEAEANGSALRFAPGEQRSTRLRASIVDLRGQGAGPAPSGEAGPR